MLHEIGKELDSKELKLRFVVEYLGAKLPSLFRWDAADGFVVRSNVMVGKEGDDESDGFGRKNGLDFELSER